MTTFPSKLEAGQVFVFGSNASGFHGAGAAGLACRGEAANTWRRDPWFLRAKRAPVGSPHRVGKWAVFGVARGFQEGREGKSYAIQTVVAPGLKRSVPLAEIEDQLVDLFAFAEGRPHFEFLLSPVGAGLAGYSAEEMAGALARAQGRRAAPANVSIPEGLYRAPKP